MEKQDAISTMPFDFNIYNTLGSIEVADKRRKSTDEFGRYLGEVAKLIDGSGFEQDVGVFLLHHHFRLSSGEIMLEVVDQEKPALITSAHNAANSEINNKFATSRWVFSEETNIRPLEFSTDPAVLDVHHRLENAPGFTSLFGKLIDDFGFQSLVGLTIIQRKGIVPEPGKIYVEKNDAESQTSTITLESPEKFPPDTLIQTVWTINEMMHYGESNFYCTTRWTCVPGYCTPDGDGHLSSPHALVPSGHDSVPDV